MEPFLNTKVMYTFFIASTQRQLFGQVFHILYHQDVGMLIFCIKMFLEILNTLFNSDVIGLSNALIYKMCIY